MDDSENDEETQEKNTNEQNPQEQQSQVIKSTNKMLNVEDEGINHYKKNDQCQRFSLYE
jgi:hypothetical protein